MSHNCINISITKNEKKSEVELKAEISVDKVAEYKKKAIAELGKEIKIDGFRAGKVPQDVLIKNIGEGKIMERTANIALSQELPLLMASEKIPAISAPAVNITKLAADNPIEFTAKIAVMPKVVISDYKKIAKDKNSKKEEVSVSDDDVDETITHLRRERAKIEKIESGLDPVKATEEAQKMEILELPALDDTFVQSLGYTNAEDFKIKLKENIKNEKEIQGNEKTRIQTMEAIIEKSEVPVPDVLVNHELDKMEAQMNEDLSRSGTNLEAYLKQSGKTREEVRADWKEAAKKRSKMQLVLAEIAKTENISADKEALEKHVEHAKEHHKEANEANVRAFYEQSLRNEAVLNWLGELK